MTGKHKITRRILALVLCAVLVLPTVLTPGAASLLSLFDGIVPMSSAASDGRTVIAVPETIYMAPSTGASNSGQYFVNNYVDANGDISLEARNNNAAGSISVYAPGSTAISFDVSSVTAGVGDPVLGGSSTDANSPYESTRWAHRDIFGIYGTGAAQDWFRFDMLNLYVNGTGLTAGNTALIEWAITIYYGDSDTTGKTYYAYSVLYSPWYQPVGAAARAKSSYRSTYASSILWVSGVHGYTDGERANSYYVQTNNFLPMLGVITTPTGNSPDGVWIQSGSNGLSPTMSYQSVDASGTKYHARANVISPTATLAVDTSRYNNFNQIPNFKVGFMITDQDNTTQGDCAWYLSDFTDQTSSYYNGTATSGSQYTGDYNSQGTVIKSASGRGIGAPVYNDTWNKAISGTASFRLKSAVKSYYSAIITTSAWDNNFVNISVIGVKKDCLRAFVLRGTSYFSGDYTSDSFENYKKELQEAALRLGNPVNSNVETSALENAENALATPITFNGNGGTLNQKATEGYIFVIGKNQQAELKAENIKDYSASRAGYDFLGWSVNKNATTPDSPLNVSCRQTLYAVWKPIEYTVKFYDMNGTTKLFDDATYTIETGLDLPQYNKTGYTWQSWTITSFTDGEGLEVNKPLNNKINAGIYGNVELTAFYTPNTYTVSFDLNGGEGTPPAPINVVYDAPYGTLPTDADFPQTTRPGYALQGWTTEQNGTQFVTADTVYQIAGDSTLYAKWTERGYAVTLQYGNGQADGTLNVVYGSAYDATGQLLTVADYPGYDFNGWFTKPQGQGEKIDGDEIYNITDNSTLYAYWTPATYTLTFKDTDGTPLAEDKVYTLGDVTLPVVEKTGYTLYWIAESKVGSWDPSEKYTTTDVYAKAWGSVSFKARWEPIAYSLTLKMNDGTDTVFSVSDYTIEDTVTPTAPTRTAYQFNGWIVENSVGSFTAGDFIKSTIAQGSYGNVTLLADWVPVEYTLTFDLNGGAYDGETAYKYTVNDELHMIVPAKDGYTFAGWDVADINVGNWVQTNGFVKEGTVLNGMYGDATLKAKWNTIQYSLTFNSNSGSLVADIPYTIETSVTMPTSRRNGYMLKWITDADICNWNAGVEYLPGAVVEAGKFGDAAFTAIWTPVTYTVALDTNGGAFADSATELTLEYNIEKGLLNPELWQVPVRNGYAFKGWLVEESVGAWVKDDTNFITSIDPDKYGDVHLRAEWEIITYDANFYSQGTLQTGLTIEDYTIETGITLPEISRDNHTFIGWQPSVSVGSWDASGVYDAMQYPGAWGTVEFNAVWEKETYTIIWNNYDGTQLEKDENVEYDKPHSYDGADPTREVTAQHTFTFTGWSAPEIVVDENGKSTYIYTAQFASTVNSYTITWVYETDEDENTPAVVVTESYYYNDDPVEGIPAFKGGIPVRQGIDASVYVWQFMGWTPALEPVTGNKTYTAVFEKNYNPITVTWYIGDEAHKTYGLQGTVPAYPTTPVLEKNDGYKCTFVGWAATENGTVLDTLPALGTENVTYYAVFTKTAITYTATLIGNSGTVDRDTETYAVEGDALELPVPVRNGYTFIGWKPLAATGNWDANSLYEAGVLGGMLGDVTLVAQWKATEYTVTIYPADGSAEYDMTYTIDGMQTLPTITREGYTFTGWYVLLGEGSWQQGQVLDLNESLAQSWGNMTIQAQWQVNRYTVTWVIDGTFATETYAYGTPIAQRTVPEKLGYIAQWNKEIPQTMPAENLEITAVYTLREYTITYNANGGEMPASYPAVYNITSTDALPVPTKAGSLFAGWQVINEGGNWILNTTTAASATLAGRYGNVTLKAVWTPTIHTITWMVDGTARIAHWYYGAMPSYDGIPEKRQDAQYTYTFKGWDKEIVTVTGDAVYEAVFDKVERKYTVTWMLDDQVLESAEYTYGQMPAFSGADPIKPANELYAYAFAGWSPAITAVDGPQTYYAQFTLYRFVQSVVLDYSNITLVNGGTLQLHASVYPSNADDPSVEWFSLDKSIATVDANGFVTAVGVGSTSICVRSLENPELVAICTIRVTPIYVSWLEITASSTTTLGIGETVQLEYILRPDNATNVEVNWVSMDAKVAVVGKNGLVTIVGEGTTKIYCYSADGYCSASISVTGLPEATEDEEDEKYVIVWFPVSQAGGGYIIDGKTFEENTIKFPYGSDIRFRLVNNNGYVVKVNGSGAYYPDEEGYYTIGNVTEDISILVFTSGDNILDDELPNDPDASKSFFEKLGDFFRKIVLWFRSLFGLN